MAYKSKAQAAKFGELVKEGKMKPSVKSDFDEASEGMELPERVPPQPQAKMAKPAKPAQPMKPAQPAKAPKMKSLDQLKQFAKKKYGV